MASRFGYFLVSAVIVLLIITALLLHFSTTGGNEIAVGNLILRAQNGTTYPLAPPAASALSADPPSSPANQEVASTPKNVIVIIGDGMGIGTVSAASQLLSPPGVPLAMEGAPVVGLMHTWAANKLATDSAAAATAMATGHKTDKGMLGQLPDGRTVETLFEAARDAGIAVAMATTSGLADATPGGFLSHAASRDDYDEILAQIVDSRADILIGGDWSAKTKAWNNSSYREMVENMEGYGSDRGYSVIRDATRLATADLPLIALFPPRAEVPLQHGPPLAETADRLLDLLDTIDRRFVAILETEYTDEAAHDNDIAASLEAMRELDETVARVLDRVATRNDTLVLVVADHETGGPHLLEGEFGDGEVVVRWAHEYHSAQLVPVFAFGPGSSAFAGVWDNTEFGVRIARLLGLEDFPQMSQ